MQRLRITLLLFLSVSFNSSFADALVPDWLSYDSIKKQVHIKLIATENANNNGLNYNGYSQGNITLIVPTDWLINISLTNWDASATHDLILTRPFVEDNIPSELTGEYSAIKRAYIAPLFANGTDSLSFTAKAGQYWLFCGVKGHGINGMWIKLIVNNVQIPNIKNEKT